VLQGRIADRVHHIAGNPLRVGEALSDFEIPLASQD
jgi:hypothetical protein